MKLVTEVKIFIYIIANMPDKQKLINSNNPDALLKVLVQLVFVNHMSNPTRFYCSVSFVSQYI